MTDRPFGDSAGTVTTGLVDLQVNGGFGHDFTTDPSTIWEVGALLPRFGVTAFLPTVITAPIEAALEALSVLADGPPGGWRGARPLGLHVEGPMISPTRRGTHPPEHLTPPSLEVAERLVHAGPPAMVTLAPELPGAAAVVRLLAEAGTVVSIGHSDASAAQAAEAVGWGARHATHLFNAMSGLDHRAPGVAAAVLTDERLTTGLIADGIHVADVMLRLAYRVMGPLRIALVTDSMAALGLGDGDYVIGSVPVTVAGLAVRNTDGALAGSAAGMDHVVRTMMLAVGASLEEVVAMASSTPLEILSRAPEPDDAVLFDDRLQVMATAVGGETVYERSPS